MSFRVRRFALLIIMVSNACMGDIVFAGQDFAYSELVSKFDANAKKGYRALLDEFGGLQASVNHFCEKPDERRFLVLKADYERSFLAWKRMDYLHTGPVSLESRSWQIQFWPDPKDIVKRTVEMYLGRYGSSAELPLSTFGVAVKGLPALEYLLFVSLENRPGEPSEAVCALARSVSGNLVEVMSAVVVEYAEYVERTPDQTRFSDYLKSAMTTLSIIEERQLAEPFGVKRGSVVYQLAESWRGGLSLVALEQNFVGVYQNVIDDLVRSREVPPHYADALALSGYDREVLSSFSDVELIGDKRLATIALKLYQIVRAKREALRSVSAEIFDVRRGFSFNDGD